jgi:hypothetical protein
MHCFVPMDGSVTLSQSSIKYLIVKVNENRTNALIEQKLFQKWEIHEKLQQITYMHIRCSMMN